MNFASLLTFIVSHANVSTLLVYPLRCLPFVWTSSYQGLCNTRSDQKRMLSLSSILAMSGNSMRIHQDLHTLRSKVHPSNYDVSFISQLCDAEKKNNFAQSFVYSFACHCCTDWPIGLGAVKCRKSRGSEAHNHRPCIVMCVWMQLSPMSNKLPRW